MAHCVCPGTQLLRCQYLHLCTSKARKRSTSSACLCQDPQQAFGIFMCFFFVVFPHFCSDRVPRARRKAQEHLPRSMRQHSSAYVRKMSAYTLREKLRNTCPAGFRLYIHKNVTGSWVTSAYVSILRLAVLHTHKCHELLRYILNRQTSAV
jgi:hypothetical protein